MSHPKTAAPEPCVPVFDTFPQSPDQPAITLESTATGGVPFVDDFENPPPLSSSPGEWVVSEAVLIGRLVKLYGWRVIEPGLLRRCRKVAP